MDIDVFPLLQAVNTSQFSNVGPTGPRGQHGLTGAQGQQGTRGQQGAQGPQGSTGPTGPINPPLLNLNSGTGTVNYLIFSNNTKGEQFTYTNNGLLYDADNNVITADNIKLIDASSLEFYDNNGTTITPIYKQGTTQSVIINPEVTFYYQRIGKTVIFYLTYSFIGKGTSGTGVVNFDCSNTMPWTPSSNQLVNFSISCNVFTAALGVTQLQGEIRVDKKFYILQTDASNATTTEVDDTNVANGGTSYNFTFSGSFIVDL